MLEIWEISKERCETRARDRKTVEHSADDKLGTVGNNEIIGSSLPMILPHAQHE